ncbi:MAG TPA: SusC/RagA family TonB-linked outer membrane protein, partial [Bacteroidales bacterium]
GIIKNTNASRFSVRFNGNIDVTSKFKINTNLSYVQGSRSLSNQGLNQKTNPLFMSLIKSPFLYPHDISDDGKISPNLADVDIFGIGNPVAAAGNKMKEINDNYRFFGTVGLIYAFSPVVNLTSLFGVTTDKVRENTFKPHLGIVADTLDNILAMNSPQVYDQRLFSLNNDTRLNYHKVFNNLHDISVMAGFRFNYNNAEADLDKSYNTATDELNTLGDGSSRVSTGSVDQWNWLNTYLGVDYAFNSKYFLSANVGVDGSSRFGKDISGALTIAGNKFGVFPSVGAAWLVSSENFMSNFRFIELLKIRVSYGITGNDDIGNYNTRQLYTSQFLYKLPGLVRQNIANPSLQWETNKKFNVGADLSLFHERLNMSLDVYRNTIDHMLTYETQPSYVGVPYILTNNGTMKGKGAEYTVNGRILNGKLKWDLGFTVAYSKNKITKLPETSSTTYGGATIISRVGSPVAGFYGFVTNGVYASDAEAAASGLQLKLANGQEVAFRGGDVRFVDLDGNKIIDDNDRKIIGDPSPEFNGMISTGLKWKRLACDAYFSYSYGNDIYNYTRYRLESMSGLENQTPAVMNRWMVNGQVTDMPRAEWGDPRGNSRFSDRWIEDGSYLRLKCLTLSYHIPYKNNYLKSAMIYASAYNLVTFTKYKGYDPEFSASSSPQLQGIDAAMVPQYRTFMVGLKLGL